MILTNKDDIKELIDNAVASSIKPFIDLIPKSEVNKVNYSRKETATKLGVSTSMVDKLRRSGKLIAYKVGRKPVFHIDNINAILNKTEYIPKQQVA